MITRDHLDIIYEQLKLCMEVARSIKEGPIPPDRLKVESLKMCVHHSLRQVLELESRLP